MTSSEFAPAVVGYATAQGPERPRNADRFATNRYTPEGGREILGLALVDGSGSSALVCEFAELAAGTAAWVGARRGPVKGVLAASELNTDTSREFPKPDGAIICAVSRPGRPLVMGHGGDCRAWEWSDEKLTALTRDHTKGERLRQQGLAEGKAAAAHDNVLINSIGRATVGSVVLTETLCSVVGFTTDGVHGKVPPAELERIMAEHPDDPQACAQAWVDAAVAAGTRDDATAAVLMWSPPGPDEPGALMGR